MGCAQCEGTVNTQGYCLDCGFNQMTFVNEYEEWLDSINQPSFIVEWQAWKEELAA